MATQWNQQLKRYVSKVIECLEQTFANKSIAKEHQIPNKWTDCKIFELKYGNTELLGNTKHLAVFVSAYLYQYGINLY